MARLDPETLARSIVASAPSFTSEQKTFFVVEKDLAIPEERVLDYARQILAAEALSIADDDPSGLVAATINGKPIRWKPGTLLTWHLDQKSFPNALLGQQAAQYARQASSDWNAAAQTAKVRISFAESQPGGDVVFRIVYTAFDDDSLYAVAFFPNAPVAERVVCVGPAMFAAGAQFDPVGVLRHELGHVLGFRHEHIRPESPKQIEPWVVGKISAEVLTQYDPQSLMHYPLVPGYGTTDFKITPRDQKGLKSLYKMSASKVWEFEP